MPTPRSPHEVEYSPSSRVASIDDELRRYAELSREAMALPHRRLATGPAADGADEGAGEGAIVFEGPAGAPLHVFVHGGYWQALSAADSLMPAPELVAAGWSFAAIDYVLAPRATIPEQIDQCTRAVRAVIDELDPSAVVLSGSSAGAHLAAHVAQRLSPPEAHPTAAVDRLVLLSGIYDLRPLVTTYVNEPLGMDDDTASAWSVPLDVRPAVDLHVLHGEHETVAFKAQSARLGAAWEVPVVEVVGRNHFDLVLDLASIDLRLGVPRRGAPHAAAPARHGGDPTHVHDHAPEGAGVAGVAVAERPGAPRRVEAEALHRPPAGPTTAAR
jgi:arylformamidase